MSTQVHAALADVSSVLWYHSIDLGDGVVTPGHPPNPALERPGAFPEVRGLSVLDIGAWDGYYSFKAEKAGAARVVALDHYAWKLDWAKRAAYWRRCEAEGRIPDPANDAEEFLATTGLPGRQGFDYAHRVLASKVEPVVADFQGDDLSALGTFDVTLFFGVLYHMPDPLMALRRVRRLTDRVAAIETEAIRVIGHRGVSLLGFVAGNELNGDYGNWYLPTDAGLRALCFAAGFRRVETRVGPPPFLRDLGDRWRTKRVLSTAERYRAVVHAYI